MRSLYLVILVVSALTANSQTIGSNANFFVNEREKNILTSAKSADYIELLLASDLSVKTADVTAFRLKIDLYVKEVQERNAGGDYPNKELKKIYKEVHAAFLSKYDEKASFIDLHQNGKYNCVTASALFAHILNQLKVPYVIRETPTHVYLVAAPDTHHIVFETTTPSAKLVEFDQKVKQQYAQYLVEEKQITREEFASARTSDLFDKYFYSDEKITSIQLVGLMYYNNGVFALEENDYLNAYNNFEKAELLHPGKKHQYLITYSLANYLLQSDRLETEEALPYLIRFTSTGKELYKKELVVGYLKTMAEKLLFKSPKVSNYRNIYHALSAGIPDTSMLSAMSDQHHMSMAHYYDIKQQTDSVFHYLDLVYRKNPEDLLLQEIITSVILQKLQSTADHGPALKFYEKILPKYGFINSNEQVMSYYMYCLASKCNEVYNKNNKTAGDATLQLMNELMQKNEHLRKNSEVLVMATIEQAYFYYIRQKQYREAKTFLLSMQKLYPEGDRIKEKIKAVDNILRYNK